MKKVISISIGIIVYLNIGYLVAYATDPTMPRTPAAEIIWEFMNFHNVLHFSSLFGNTFIFLFTMLLWPLIVLSILTVNVIKVMIDAVMYLFSSIQWIFNGEIWRLMGLIK